MPRLARIAPLLAMAVLLGGCAADDDGAVTTTTSTPATTTAGDATSTTGSATTSAATTAPTTAPTTSTTTSPTITSRAPMTFEVSIEGNVFVDGTLAIQRGDTVRWVHNDGTVPHSVTAQDGSFDSNDGLPCPGPGCMTEVARNTFSHTFDETGAFDYFCEVHPSMAGTVTVA